MKLLFFLVLSMLAIVLQSVLVTWPLFLGLIACIVVIDKKPVVFLIAFLLGLILDSITFHPAGASSLFFICFLFLIFLYQRKFEIRTMPFLFFSSLIGSIIYLELFGYREI